MYTSISIERVYIVVLMSACIVCVTVAHKTSHAMKHVLIHTAMHAPTYIHVDRASAIPQQSLSDSQKVLRDAWSSSLL